MVAAFLGCLSSAPVQAAAGTNIYQTGFEVAQGFNTNTYYLVGQGGWTGEGTGGNGILQEQEGFTGKGQQAYIGYFPPDSTNEDYFLASYPINLATIPARPPIRFSVLMEIMGSNNGYDDTFRWVVHNSKGERLFLIEFDNSDNSVWTKSGTNDWRDADLSFNNGIQYELVVRMDYGQNRWSAALAGQLIAADEPIAAPAQLADLGDIAAFWSIDDPVHPGDNWMLFDDYRMVYSEIPPIIIDQPRSQAVLAGNAVSFKVSAYSALPFRCQWQFNGTNIPAATNSVLTLTNVQSAHEGQYVVIVANSAASVISQVARLTVVGPSGVIYQTGFEIAQGFNTNDYNLIGQGGWKGDGTGGNGILTEFFAGKGQQAFIGYNAPWSLNEDHLYAYYPINLSPVPANQPIRFSVLMKVVDSSNDYYDYFQWAAYNTNGDRLFLVEFDNTDNSVWTKSGTNWFDTGFTFENNVTYELAVRMDFGRNLWSATLDGLLLVTNQPIAAPGQLADLGDVTAYWVIDDSVNPGDNWMVFDDYRVAFEANQMTLAIQPQSLPSPGNPGSFRLTVVGPAGQVMDLLSSSNLTTWNAIGTITNQTGTVQFIDKSPYPKQGFYRTRLVP